jgi:hypothetical protein
VFPFYWRKDHDWLLMPLAWHTQKSAGVGPVWWGKDFFHVFPIYWSHGSDWTIPPLAWHREGGSTGVGPVWWSGDKAGVFPLYWKAPNRWALLPVAGHNKHGVDWAGPLWRNKRSGSGGLFPIYWQAGKNWTLFPLLWNRVESFTLFPFYWTWRKAGHTNRVLFPLAWDTDTSTGVGPVWKSGSKFTVFPLYWKNGADWFLAPLAWRDSRHQGLLPLYWKWKGDDQSTRSIIPPLLAYSESSGETSRTRALLGMINYTRDPNGNTFELQPLIKTRSGKVEHFSILWRLFESHKDATESYYRFLFLPHKFGRTETPKP